jgi:hypothetical protein
VEASPAPITYLRSRQPKASSRLAHITLRSNMQGPRGIAHFFAIGKPLNVSRSLPVRLRGEVSKRAAHYIGPYTMTHEKILFILDVAETGSYGRTIRRVPASCGGQTTSGEGSRRSRRYSENSNGRPDGMSLRCRGVTLCPLR